MKTNTFIHRDFIESGEARVFLLDTNHDGDVYQYLGKVEDVTFTVDKEVRTLSQNVRGQEYEIDSRIVGQTASLSMTLLEDANPECAKLIWGDSTTSQTVDNTYSATQAVESRYLYGTGDQILLHQRGILQASNMGTPVMGTPSTSTDSWTSPLTTGTSYEMWVVPAYGTNPSTITEAMVTADIVIADGTDTTGKDVSWTMGTPIAVSGDPATGANTSIQVDVTAFTITKGAVAPDFWVILIDADSGDLTTATFAATQDASGSYPDTITVGTAGSVTYTASNQYFTKRTTASGAPYTYTLTSAVPATDCVLDKNTGELNAPSTGSFLDGGHCHITYWYWETPNVEDDLGNEGTPNDERQLMIVCLGEDDPLADVEDMREEGLVYILEKCNVAAINGAQTFTKNDWHAGQTATIPVLRTSANNRFGTRTILKTILKNHVIGYN